MEDIDRHLRDVASGSRVSMRLFKLHKEQGRVLESIERGEGDEEELERWAADLDQWLASLAEEFLLGEEKGAEAEASREFWGSGVMAETQAPSLAEDREKEGIQELQMEGSVASESSAVDPFTGNELQDDSVAENEVSTKGMQDLVNPEREQSQALEDDCILEPLPLQLTREMSRTDTYQRRGAEAQIGETAAEVESDGPWSENFPRGEQSAVAEQADGMGKEMEAMRAEVIRMKRRVELLRTNTKRMGMKEVETGEQKESPGMFEQPPPPVSPRTRRKTLDRWRELEIEIMRLSAKHRPAVGVVRLDPEWRPRRCSRSARDVSRLEGQGSVQRPCGTAVLKDGSVNSADGTGEYVSEGGDAESDQGTAPLVSDAQDNIPTRRYSGLPEVGSTLARRRGNRSGGRLAHYDET